MRLTWLSKMVSGSTACPEVVRSHCAKADLAARFAPRNAPRKPRSSARGSSLASSPRSVIQPLPMASVMMRASAGFASSSQRRGVTPLVLLLKRSGNISARSLTVVERRSAEWIAATPLVLCEPTMARFAIRTCFVGLDGRFVGKRAPVSIAAAEAPDQIGQRAGDEKVLLEEPQPLPPGRGVVGIENPSEGLGGERPRQRADELTMTERLEIELHGYGRRPEAKGVDRLAAVPHHGAIERNADQRGRPPGDRAQRSVPDLDRAVQPDFDLVVRANDLPRVGATKPVVGLLVLPAAFDGLPEHPVLVAESVPHRRQLHRRHRVEKIRGQAPEAAIAQSGVGLLLEQTEPIERRLLDGIADEGAEQQIGDVVGERAADQE